MKRSHLEELIASIQTQTYKRWELILVDGGSRSREFEDVVCRVIQDDERIVIEKIAGICSISETQNAGIEVSHGDYLCFLQSDAILEPDALFECAYVLQRDPEVGLIYADEDRMLPNGQFTDGFFKPAFDLYYLRSMNYLGGFLCVKASLFETVGLFDSALEGAQDLDLALRVVEAGTSVAHVSRILCHRRKMSAPDQPTKSVEQKVRAFGESTGKRAIEAHLKRSGIVATVEEGPLHNTYHVRYASSSQPKVSIIIPSCDQRSVFERCMTSLLEKTEYLNYEVIVVENNSAEPETFAYYDEISKDERVRVIRWQDEFNFSKIINYGASFASGEYLVLLNNDTEVIASDWLSLMVGIAQQNDVGVVGAKLLFPNGSVQHMGVVFLDLEHMTHHLQSGIPGDAQGNFGYAVLIHEASAVTGACLLTPKALFDELGGLSEEFVIGFNDIDYCYRVTEAGYRVILEPNALLYHYESLSRDRDEGDSGRYERARFEEEKLYKRWFAKYKEGDPCHNPNFVDSFCQLKEAGWQKKVDDTAFFRVVVNKLRNERN